MKNEKFKTFLKVSLVLIAIIFSLAAMVLGMIYCNNGISNMSVANAADLVELPNYGMNQIDNGSFIGSTSFSNLNSSIVARGCEGNLFSSSNGYDSLLHISNITNRSRFLDCRVPALIAPRYDLKFCFFIRNNSQTPFSINFFANAKGSANLDSYVSIDNIYLIDDYVTLQPGESKFLDFSSFVEEITYNGVVYTDFELTNISFGLTISISGATNFDIGYFYQRISYYENLPSGFLFNYNIPWLLNYGSANNFNPDGESFKKGFTEGLEQGRAEGDQQGFNRGEKKGYQAGYNDATSAKNSFTDLANAVIGMPVKFMEGIFNFDVLGFDMKNVMFSILTICIFLVILNIVLRGKA